MTRTAAREQCQPASRRETVRRVRCTSRPAESEAIRTPIVDEFGWDRTLADAIREELSGPCDTREASVPNSMLQPTALRAT